ncbi:MAG: hypothetical protein DYG89_44890 [Caldilinea sp. CFX5]|nr:hypothetical protein [Caldilinea sp. CFX5]
MSQVITAQILPNVGPFANRRHWFKYIILCLPLFVISCAAFQRRETAALPLTEVLPAAWSPLRDVEEVNIDGDAAPEYLLFFTYDTTTAAAPRRPLFSMGGTTPNGPIGAVIYDGQVVTGTTPTVQVSPDRPTTAFVPYAILPSYRAGAGLGYVAEPTQSEAIDAYAVSYRTAGQTTGAAGVAAPDTVILLGGQTYLTFAWWQNRANGYGVTQLYAPGGFEGALYKKFDWADWTRTPQAIREIIAVHPLHDRNLICRRFRYVLDEAALGAGRPGLGAPLRFQQSDLGLQFCAGTPVHPFYPEGVVLAYLLEGREELVDAVVVTTTLSMKPNELPWLRELIQDKGVQRIDDLASYTTLSVSHTVQPTIPPDTISVCALLTLQPTPTDPASAPREQRELLFLLRHQPAGFQPPTPDQLFIQTVETLQTVEMLAAPNGESMINCRQRLGG